MTSTTGADAAGVVGGETGAESTVVLFTGRREARSKTAAHVDSISAVLWPVGELVDQQQCSQWLSAAVAGKSYEGTAISLWTHHPNLREATERLAQFITPKWPASDGTPLLNVAIERAVSRAQDAIQNREAFEGRLIGVYLYGLISVVTDIARLGIMGVDRAGLPHRWKYFSCPLQEWARGHGMDTVTVQIQGSPPDALLRGLRTHMTACLTNPVDAGYLAKYAPEG